ncbi:MAG: YkgJ family cysteine cluster protein [Desulfobacteraceae bacterium]
MSCGTSGDTVFIPLAETDKFRFRCHKGISCFTQCCAGLNLLLTPYDIVRLKSRLGMSSDEFIERYTEPKMDEPYVWPVIRLLMKDDQRKSCPFVTSEGCTVYEDRPGACRIYPLGRASMTPDRGGVREKFFLVKEPHCKGFEEDREWDAREWMASEGVDLYNSMNDSWLRILTNRTPVGPKEAAARKHAMFFMASYNLDRFRDFVFKSSFLDRFHVDPATREAIASDDTALMTFAFDWLRFSLFGEQTMSTRDPS